MYIPAATVYRVNAHFWRTGEVHPEDRHKRRSDLRRLDERSEIYIVGLVIHNPTMYLGEVCHQIHDVCGLEYHHLLFAVYYYPME